MSWTQVLANWPLLLEHLCDDFRHLELTALRRFRGDQEKLVLYLAQTHDLTVLEARDTLENWLIYKGATLEAKAAA